MLPSIFHYIDAFQSGANWTSLWIDEDTEIVACTTQHGLMSSSLDLVVRHLHQRLRMTIELYNAEMRGCAEPEEFVDLVRRHVHQRLAELVGTFI